MNEIWAGVQEAFRLIFILDADLIEITLRSLEGLGWQFGDFAIVALRLQCSTR